MTKAPNRWLAALLGLVGGPLGVLYAGRPVAAIVYGAALVLLAGFGLLWGDPIMLMMSLLSTAVTLAGVIHAYRAARSWQGGRARSWYSRWFGLLAVAGGFLVAVTGARAFFFEPFRMPSGAMLPTVGLGSSIVVKKWGYGHYSAYGFMLVRRTVSGALERGDLLVFDAPKLENVQYVKRLIGMPGDEISYEGRRLQINGQPLEYEDRATYWDSVSMRMLQRKAERIDGRTHEILVDDGRPALPPKDMLPSACVVRHPERLVCRVPAGHVFMMGDNRDNSLDSRYVGAIPLESIVGKVVRVGTLAAKP